MSRFLILLVAGLLFCPDPALGQKVASFGKSDQAAIEQLLDRYSRAYSTKDYAALRECIQVPFIRFPAGTAIWDVQGTMDEAMTYYKNQREALEKDNYDHSQFVRTQITALGSNRALVDQIYRRYRKDGTVLLEASAIYVVSKSSGTWKLCGILAQDLEEYGKEHRTSRVSALDGRTGGASGSLGVAVLQ